MNPLATSESGQPEPKFLKGGGEMGARIRSFDWASTPIGSSETWPQGLRISVNTILNSRFPMLIFWGADMIQFYNDAFRPSLGNEGKHPLALGQRAAECWAEIWPAVQPLLMQVLSGGEAIWNEDQLIPIYRNGQLEDVYWTYSYSAIMDENGEVCGILVVCSENTAKIISHKKLQESENQLSFAIEAAELGTWDYNPLTNKFTSNERLKHWFGLNPLEEIELGAAIEAMLEDDRARVASAIQRALQYESGGSYDIKYTIRNKLSGEEKIVRAKGRAWFNEEKIAYRFNGILQDITDLEKVHYQLEQAEEKARLAIESADLGTYEIDLITDEVITSERYRAIFGVSGHLSRKALAALIHPEDIPIRVRANEVALRTGHIGYEARINHPDESTHWMKANGTIIYNAEGKPSQLIGVIQDITEQKEIAARLTQEVKERTAELQRSNNDLLQFAHVITHDLKEPVRKIKVFGSRIEEETGSILPERAKVYLGKIQHATERMSAMIEGVLDYSVVNSFHEDVVVIDLNETIKSIQNDLEMVIQQKSAVVSFDGLPSIEGVPILIYQLFYNLMTNSLKFAKENIPPMIVFTASPLRKNNEGFVEITVADNGIGFGKEHAENIFNTFTRLNSKDKYEGTGLGLALSKKIVERHGGQLTASGSSDGATFRIVLPLVQKN